MRAQQQDLPSSPRVSAVQNRREASVQRQGMKALERRKGCLEPMQARKAKAQLDRPAAKAQAPYVEPDAAPAIGQEQMLPAPPADNVARVRYRPSENASCGSVALSASAWRTNR